MLDMGIITMGSWRFSVLHTFGYSPDIPCNYATWKGLVQTWIWTILFYTCHSDRIPGS
ncbi:hypothetical protein BDV36DRAFT_252141 [Aspergillus pseudocaelatus]|uniref:Uncharacterized protein n=1 Tax=Aspergillus pseudocaelatus TaxID=1825620 RepID=A0ABQ6WQ16_9EURO|nr:hypothetical protein BDV36DRAFT_252141 [Aspergillus pseudocaelatus]